ncbi:MAG TPA: TetR/AcrR family transcriptional regulator [Casimicrobiaceae bacterium]|nr:TetR/AcrR family transcriptional regulator [Casimicrobiaceae bacterium]
MPKVRQGGRPSPEASEQLGELILDAATDLFLTHGFGATSVEAVAQRVRISKRTFYHRFSDKRVLFAAVVHRIIKQLRPPAGSRLIEGADVQEVLERLAALILRAALSPQATALHRLIVAESVRFPELIEVFAREGAAEEATTLIAGVLEREMKAGRLRLDDCAFAAQQFLQMVITVPRRRAMGLGAPMSKRELTEWPPKVVGLFLNGCKGN